MNTLETALRLGTIGLRVAFGHWPISDGKCSCGASHTGSESSIGKHPIGRAWQRTASEDEQSIRDSFLTAGHGCNVGVVLGPCAAGYIVAIDVDDASRLAELEVTHGELPATLTGRSPRGARMFYRVAERFEDLRNVTGIGGSKGVDCKTKGGFVVVGPSLHSNGGRYTWDNLETPIAELPVVWLQAILPPPKPKPAKYEPGIQSTKETTRHRKWAQAIARREADLLARAPEGQRNHVLYAAACRTLPAVYGAGLSGYDAKAELTNAAKACGLADAEIARTLRSADEWIEKNGIRRELPPPVLTVVGGTAVAAQPADDEAIDLIECDGQIAKLEENIARMLRMYPTKIRFDEFSQRFIYGDTWLTDEHISIVRGWLHDRPKSQRVSAAFDTVSRGIQLAGKRNKFHQVRDYLDARVWDGTERIERFFVTYFGVSDSLYARTASRLFLVGLVARVRNPGCKLDESPILEGEQGLKKSSALAALVGDAWFRDSKLNLGDKDSYQNLLGAWLYELPELAATRAKDVETVKGFLTARFDDFRAPYARYPERYLRQCAFVGSTNDEQYLPDRSGNRRWNCLKCTRIDRDGIVRDRDQLWAEASVMYATNPIDWWQRSEDYTAEQREAASEREIHEPFDDRVIQLPPDVNRLTADRILERMGFSPGERNRTNSTGLSSALRRANWTRHNVRLDGVQVRVWVRP